MSWLFQPLLPGGAQLLAESIEPPVVVDVPRVGGYWDEEADRRHNADLRAKRARLARKRRDDIELLRKLIRRAAGIEEIVSEAQEAKEELSETKPPVIDGTVSAASLARVEVKLEAISQRITELQDALARHEAEEADEDDVEALLLLAA